MKKIVLIVMILSLVCITAVTAHGANETAPAVPKNKAEYMPRDTESFSDGIWYVIRAGIDTVSPDIGQAMGTCLCVIAAVILCSVIKGFQEKTKTVVSLAGAVMIASILLGNASVMIRLGTETVHLLSDYGKLLLPVMTTALASQGGITSSAALYAGTAIFDAVLSSLISTLIVPMIYIFVALATANCALGENALKKMTELFKWLIGWSLKTVLYVFTGYMAITGVVSGTTDQAALRATKLTISGMVPVVGGILSDTSEAILVGAGAVKNAAGIYGLLAVVAIMIEPFLRIGMQYLLLKLTAAVCGVFAEQKQSDLIQEFSTAMGFVLAMIGTVTLMFVVSLICFMKGMS